MKSPPFRSLCELERDGGMNGRDYDERVLRSCLALAMLSALDCWIPYGFKVTMRQRLQEFLEFTIGPSPHGKLQEATIKFLNASRCPRHSAALPVLYLRSSGRERARAWTFIAWLTKPKKR